MLLSGLGEHEVTHCDWFPAHLKQYSWPGSVKYSFSLLSLVHREGGFKNPDQNILCLQLNISIKVYSEMRCWRQGVCKKKSQSTRLFCLDKVLQSLPPSYLPKKERFHVLILRILLNYSMSWLSLPLRGWLPLSWCSQDVLNWKYAHSNSLSWVWHVFCIMDSSEYLS